MPNVSDTHVRQPHQCIMYSSISLIEKAISREGGNARGPKMLSSDVLEENVSTSYGKYFGTSSIFLSKEMLK